MGLEAATFIADLVDTNPLSTDKKRQGDDHLRLIKEVSQNTFPNADKAFYFPTMQSKTASWSVVTTDMNKTFMVSTASAEVVATLPVLTADDDGWQCHFIKTNTGLNALFIAPASGTLQSGEVSGLAQCRRVIPGHRCTAMWDGSAWYVTRVPSVPIGTVLDLTVADLPVGYEWPNGQTLASASTKYPEFYAKNGNSGVTRDICGRVVAGKDDMGESSNNRLTAAGCGIDGDTLGAAGGAETHTLTLSESAAHDHGGVTDTVTPTITTKRLNNLSANAGSNVMAMEGPSENGTSTTIVTQASHSHVIESAGGGGAHNNVQPTIVLNKILVVE